MTDGLSIGSYGIYPFLSEDLMKQAKYSQIKTRAGRMAYILSLKEKAPKPKIEDGVDPAKGALKWIKKYLEEEKG